MDRLTHRTNGVRAIQRGGTRERMGKGNAVQLRGSTGAHHSRGQAQWGMEKMREASAWEKGSRKVTTATRTIVRVGVDMGGSHGGSGKGIVSSERADLRNNCRHRGRNKAQESGG